MPLAASLVAGPSAAWGQLAGSAPAVAVETRAIPGRDVKQVIAQGRIDAPPHAVRAVTADLEGYPGFMPYVKESRVLGRETSGDALNHQRLSFGMPFVQDRHYVIRVTEREYRDEAGPRAWAFVWRLEDALPSDVRTDAAVLVGAVGPDATTFHSGPDVAATDAARSPSVFSMRVRQFQAGSSQAHQGPSQSGPASRESFSGKRTLFEVELSRVVPEQRSCRRARCSSSRLT